MKNLSARKVDYEKFEKLNVQILGISASNPFSQKTFADSLKLPFPLLSDYPELKVIRNYPGVQTHKKTKQLVAKRSFFVIDKHGILRGKWVVKNTDLMPSETILNAMRKFWRRD